MLIVRQELKVALCRYASDTLSSIHTARRFCQRFDKWMLRRETELEMMMDIKDRTDQLNTSLKEVGKSESKGSAFGRYLKNLFTPA
ncbi:unnamed protein product [Menidia menidia]|uniref:(Atlantic silverside) hypothetical protein n=1 Tax=Menidia menidia TaxID=238744 RepID=A0A8S4AS61_9TELE|nr:unnamed protein product [Menidia menidia]